LHGHQPGGRAAIVTGGSKGIGFAIATCFAASGADVAIVARGREVMDQPSVDWAADRSWNPTDIAVRATSGAPMTGHEKLGRSTSS
jgi:NAD(P)-dependent dehydrogenase (short-subunit alcohol dehydrogenase family)